MVQNPWNKPTTDTLRAEALTDLLPNMADNLRTDHSGAGEPTDTAGYMRWLDTVNNTLKRRDAGDAAWIKEGPLGKDWTYVGVPSQFGAVSATTARRVLASPQAGRVRGVSIVSDTASSSSSGNEWTFMLRNLTTSLDLFSGTVGTFTALAGVGGGAELGADVRYLLVPDQNQVVAAGDVLRFTMTAVGTVTSLADVMVQLDFSLTEEA